MSNPFSEYEYRKLGIRVNGEEAALTMECIGSVEETLGTKTVTKKCRGVVRKRTTKGTGTGKIKISGHWPYDIYTKVLAMDRTDLIDGVKAYGENSTHPKVCITADVFDEDDVEKLKAWPKCTLSGDWSRKTTNGDEEVAEVELEFDFMPDDNGEGVYEALVEGLNKTVAEKWMTSFERALVIKTD